MLATRKKDWVLTHEAFERLLALLDADRERAGHKYETVRRKLIEFFEARGSYSPAEHADETINRLARRISEGEEIHSPERYVYGVARLLLKEMLRSQAREPIPSDLAPGPGIATNDEEHEQRQQEQDRRLECFESCLTKLSPASRVLIVEYYREERGIKIEERKRQADALKMTLNALRLRACRIRTELGHCISTCLARSAKTRNQ